MIKIAPSLLSADFARLGEDIDSVKTADYLHFDVMDGIFVPNISVGLPVLKSVRRYTDMPIDVHLMITKPLRYVKDFAEAGADIIVVHLEADGRENIHRAIDTIHSLGKLAGLSIKPGTPASDNDSGARIWRPEIHGGYDVKGVVHKIPHKRKKSKMSHRDRRRDKSRYGGGVCRGRCGYTGCRQRRIQGRKPRGAH